MGLSQQLCLIFIIFTQTCVEIEPRDRDYCEHMYCSVHTQHQYTYMSLIIYNPIPHSYGINIIQFNKRWPCKTSFNGKHWTLFKVHYVFLWNPLLLCESIWCCFRVKRRSNSMSNCFFKEFRDTNTTMCIRGILTNKKKSACNVQRQHTKWRRLYQLHFQKLNTWFTMFRYNST